MPRPCFPWLSFLANKIGMKIKKSLQEKGALQSVYAEDYERFKVMKE